MLFWFIEPSQESLLLLLLERCRKNLRITVPLRPCAAQTSDIFKALFSNILGDSKRAAQLLSSTVGCTRPTTFRNKTIENPNVAALRQIHVVPPKKS